MMDEESKELLQRIKENDDNLTKLFIGNDTEYGYEESFIFNSSKGSDFTKLGQYIATNTYLEKLQIDIQSLANVNIRKGFYDGLRSNSTIQTLMLRCNYALLGDVGNEILRAYHVNSRHLTHLYILRANLQQNEAEHIALTLRSCTNLTHINLCVGNINDHKLASIVDALRGQSSLERLYLNRNSIGNDGCEALATLLSHPNCNLQEIQLSNNNIGNEGAITIGNSLANNTTLKKIFLNDNAVDHSVAGIFCNLLCNTTSIDSIYSSNHTLCGLHFGRLHDSVGHLSQLLIINGKTNKRHVVMKKILKYNKLDMQPLYDWDSEDEYSLKALPFVINWLENARVAVKLPQTREEMRMAGGHREEDPGRRYNIDERKLSAIYQFARDMPLMFVDQRVLRRSKRKRVGS